MRNCISCSAGVGGRASGASRSVPRVLSTQLHAYTKGMGWEKERGEEGVKGIKCRWPILTKGGSDADEEASVFEGDMDDREVQSVRMNVYACVCVYTLEWPGCAREMQTHISPSSVLNLDRPTVLVAACHSMCISMYVHIYIYHMCIYIYIYMYTYMHVHIYMCI